MEYLRDNELSHLSPEEVDILADKYHKGLECDVDKLILYFIPIILNIAGKIIERFNNAKFEPSDFIDAGTKGMLNSAKKFELNRGFKFFTYARYGISDAVNKELIKVHYPITLTEGVFKNPANSFSFSYLDLIADLDRDIKMSTSKTPLTILCNKEKNRNMLHAINTGLSSLTFKKRKAIKERFFENLNYREMSEKNSCSDRASRQLTEKALMKLKEFMEK